MLQGLSTRKGSLMTDTITVTLGPASMLCLPTNTPLLAPSTLGPQLSGTEEPQKRLSMAWSEAPLPRIEPPHPQLHSSANPLAPWPRPRLEPWCRHFSVHPPSGPEGLKGPNGSAWPGPALGHQETSAHTGPLRSTQWPRQGSGAHLPEAELVVQVLIHLLDHVFQAQVGLGGSKFLHHELELHQVNEAVPAGIVSADTERPSAWSPRRGSGVQRGPPSTQPLAAAGRGLSAGEADALPRDSAEALEKRREPHILQQAEPSSGQNDAVWGAGGGKAHRTWHSWQPDQTPAGPGAEAGKMGLWSPRKLYGPKRRALLGGPRQS